MHPLLHSLEIFAYILVVNVLFGILIYYVTEESLAAFLQGGLWYQPLIAAAVGLIPNCASSVVITQTYILGGLSFGGCIAGLCANAGLGFVILFKNARLNTHLLCNRRIACRVFAGRAVVPAAHRRGGGAYPQLREQRRHHADVYSRRTVFRRLYRRIVRKRRSGVCDSVQKCAGVETQPAFNGGIIRYQHCRRVCRAGDCGGICLKSKIFFAAARNAAVFFLQNRAKSCAGQGKNQKSP